MNKYRIGSLVGLALILGSAAMMNRGNAPVLTAPTVILCALAICVAIVGGWL